MNPVSWKILLAVTLFCTASQAASPAKRDNYVVFNVKGDCGQEDCIAVLRDSLKPLRTDIVSVDALTLIEHQAVDFKPITITFRDLRTAPFAQVVQLLTAQGYYTVAYVIHDTHAGTDVIIPH